MGLWVSNRGKYRHLYARANRVNGAGTRAVALADASEQLRGLVSLKFFIPLRIVYVYISGGIFIYVCKYIYMPLMHMILYMYKYI